MKKAALTLFVIATFAIYSFHQHDEESAKVVAPTPSANKTATTQTTPTTTSTNASTTSSATYKDGQYTGSSADAFFGFVQVKATISGGRLVSVEFLSYPNDRPNSVEINQQAMPLLQQEAIKAQSSKVDIISGATDTSQAFIKSLSVALNSALAA